MHACMYVVSDLVSLEGVVLFPTCCGDEDQTRRSVECVVCTNSSVIRNSFETTNHSYLLRIYLIGQF